METLVIRCLGIRKDGSPCSARPLGKSDFCIGHHEKAQEWRKKGGYASSDANRARNMMPQELRPLANQILETMNDLLEGQVTPSQGSAFAALTNSLIRVIEVGVLESRISGIEKLITHESE